MSALWSLAKFAAAVPNAVRAVALPIFFDNSHKTELRAAAFKVVLNSVLNDPSVSSMFNSPAADSYFLKNLAEKPDTTHSSPELMLFAIARAMNTEANLHVRELVVDTLHEWAEASQLPQAAPFAAVARVALQLIRYSISKGIQFDYEALQPLLGGARNGTAFRSGDN